MKHIVEAAALRLETSDFWDNLSPEGKKAYLQKHPGSKHATSKGVDKKAYFKDARKQLDKKNKVKLMPPSKNNAKPDKKGLMTYKQQMLRNLTPAQKTAKNAYVKLGMKLKGKKMTPEQTKALDTLKKAYDKAMGR